MLLISSKMEAKKKRKRGINIRGMLVLGREKSPIWFSGVSFVCCLGMVTLWKEYRRVSLSILWHTPTDNAMPPLLVHLQHIQLVIIWMHYNNCINGSQINIHSLAIVIIYTVDIYFEFIHLTARITIRRAQGDYRCFPFSRPCRPRWNLLPICC